MSSFLRQKSLDKGPDTSLFLLGSFFAPSGFFPTKLGALEHWKLPLILQSVVAWSLTHLCSKAGYNLLDSCTCLFSLATCSPRTTLSIRVSCQRGLASKYEFIETGTKGFCSVQPQVSRHVSSQAKLLYKCKSSQADHCTKLLKRKLRIIR